jgi:hypothetical protein
MPKHTAAVPIQPPSRFAVQRALAVLRGVREALIADDPSIADDPRLMTDMLDGEGGNALDIIADDVRAAIEAEALADIARKRAAELYERANRLDRRCDTLKRGVRDVLLELGLPRLERDDFTASVNKGYRHVIVTGPYPDEYARITREPKKKEMKEALDAGKDLPFASLSNPEPGLTVRTS